MVKENSPLYKIMLFSAAFIWGSSFFIMKNTVDVVPPDYLLAIRFSTAAILLALVFIKRLLAHLTLEYVLRGALLGLFLFGGYWFQTVGITDTTPGKNAFLTAAYVILVPFFFWALTKTRPDRYNLLAALLLIAGVGFVCLDAQLNIGFGDLMTLVGAVFYAIHIVFVAKFSQGRDILVLTIYQFATIAVVSWVIALTTGTWPVGLVWTPELIGAFFYLIIPCSCIALVFQNVAQKHVPPAVASILLSLESVFGVACSMLFYGEMLTMPVALGFILIFFAVLVSETKPKLFKRQLSSKPSE